ncbi:MAG: phosphate acyltransferase PlsX [Thermacetogeniaceae bacterium]|nr:phosphate acyltransferase PlsX [Thermoanaerobacterales bacterium]NLN21308.1 phosphate acyltransferase PlsX [Syntrophomonadaceae bacterium]HAF17183.1 phosphate acyltransferase PlsX [Peptococcaceae bacterium]
MRIAVDVMGGDYAPGEIVKGSVDAVINDGIEVVLVGEEEQVRNELIKYDFPDHLISVVNAGETIEMDEHPAKAVRRKKDASLVVATRLVKNGEAAALLSAGNTGAQMAAALFELGRFPGVERPGIATVLPSPQGPKVLIDSGANVDAKAEHLVCFAYLGSAFAEGVLGISEPRVALLNIGSESSKGNDLVVKAYQLLQGTDKLYFKGNIESRDLMAADVDVIVCDGFVGNITLKAVEGIAAVLMAMIKDELTRNPLRLLGGALVKPGFIEIRKKLDYNEYGGAPLLGVKGLSIICHGSSRARAIKNAIRYARQAAESNLLGLIEQKLEGII